MMLIDLNPQSFLRGQSCLSSAATPKTVFESGSLKSHLQFVLDSLGRTLTVMSVSGSMTTAAMFVFSVFGGVHLFCRGIRS